ncbi:AAA domain-containing protein, partial [Desulfovibrio sp. OttesenSCG-928-A18]|nr:AAA domain-containing protein [Desulfovibrio sp. OttesenSCG-928-A18]
MQLKICSPDGLKASEVRAIAMLQEKLRDSWHGFASFLVNDGQGSMEIDLLMITHDRFILCEIKEWAGTITSDGRQWTQHFSNGRSKTHPSPVYIKRGHAQRLTSLFDSDLKSLWGGFYFVDYVIILSGSATLGELPESEKRVVFKLEDFLKINDGPDAYNSRLPQHNTDAVFKTGHLKRPNDESQIKIFKRWLEGDKAIKPRQRLTDGYLLPESSDALFKHPKNFYQEFTGSHNENQKLKALLRCWDFFQLGSIAMTPESRAKIALRERRVIEYVSVEAPQIKKDYLMQPKHSATEGEIEEDFIEVYEHPPLLTRLDMYLENITTPDDKITCIRSILTPFVELHKLELAHRDISIERLWHDDHSKSILISGLIAARFPEGASQKSVSDIREELSSNLIPIPEEKLGEEVDAMRLDVYLLGAIVYNIAFGEQLTRDDVSLVWHNPKHDPFDGKLDEWIKKAIDIESSRRYASAQEMMEALSKISFNNVAQNGDEQAIMRELAAFNKVELIPFATWPPVSSFDTRDGRQSYHCTTDLGDSVLKLWPTLMPIPGNYAKNRKIYDFIKRCQMVQRSQLNIATPIDFGISANGLYIVQQYLAGQTLDRVDQDIARDDAGLEKRLSLAQKLISSVKLLHESGLAHGDLKPDNILITDTNNDDLIFLDFFDLDQHGNRLYNTDYSPDAQHGAFGRDIYATYCIIDEIFSRCGGYAQKIRAEIKRALGDDSQTVPISLTPLQETIDSATMLGGDIPPEAITFYNNGIKSDERPVSAYTGEFYIALDDRKFPHFKLFITGSHEKLTVHASMIEETTTVTNAWISPVSPADVLRESRKKYVKKMRCNLFWNSGKGDNTQFFQKIFEIFDTPSSNAHQEPVQLPKKEPCCTTNVAEIWECIHTEEFEQYPKVKVVDGEEKLTNGTISVEIEEDINDLGLDTSDMIEVTDGDPDHPWFFGELDLSKSKANTLVIKKVGRKKIRKNDSLQLREQRSAVSWRRRREALDRILRNEALIPDLLSMFSSSGVKLRRELAPLPEPSPELWAIYERKLDPSKLAAFKHVLSGQLNVIMGPPGTGKTTLLSYLLDYLGRLHEVNRVLLVSQSHIAVNEVATRTKQVMLAVNEELGESNLQITQQMVRLGDRDRVNESLLDVHIDALQSQYRTAFLRDVENRLAVLAKRLMLPSDFVLQAASLYRNVVSELHQYSQLRTNTEQIDDVDIQTIQKRKERLYKILYNKFAECTDNPEAIFAEQDMQKALLESIALRNGINNPRQISKLNAILTVTYQWYQRLSADSEGFAGFMARTRSLVIGTLVGIGKSAYDIASHRYDVAIIDEAGRASASELAMAMQSAHRVILVGDHRQLPPHYGIDIVEQVAKKLRMNALEVAKTDFERAYEQNNGVMLDTQYRMQEPICTLVSEIFYDGKLRTGIPREVYLGTQSPWNVAVCWLDTSLLNISESRLGTSVVNNAEIEIICTQLKTLTNDAGSMRKLREWAAEGMSL